MTTESLENQGHEPAGNGKKCRRSRIRTPPKLRKVIDTVNTEEERYKDCEVCMMTATS